MRNRRTLGQLLLLALSGIAVAACSDAKAANVHNFEMAIRANASKQDQRLCTNGMVIPATVMDRTAYGASDNWNHPEYDALVHVGLLTVTNSSVRHPAAFFSPAYTERRKTWRLAPAGQPYAQTEKSFLGSDRTKFCFASKTVDHVTNFTEPGDMGGMKVSDVRYTYALQNVAPWARDPHVQANFNDIAQAMQGEHTREEHAMVTLTNNGWEVQH